MANKLVDLFVKQVDAYLEKSDGIRELLADRYIYWNSFKNREAAVAWLTKNNFEATDLTFKDVETDENLYQHRQSMMSKKFEEIKARKWYWATDDNDMPICIYTVY